MPQQLPSCHVLITLSFPQGQETIPGIKKLLGDESEQEEGDQEEPPASVLHSRRQALVPPKLITDDYESANDDLDQHSSGRQSSNL